MDMCEIFTYESSYFKELLNYQEKLSTDNVHVGKKVTSIGLRSLGLGTSFSAEGGSIIAHISQHVLSRKTPYCIVVGEKKFYFNDVVRQQTGSSSHRRYD